MTLNGTNKRLHGRTAVITGTGGGRSGGTGRAAALLFARHGANVVGCDIDPVSGERTVELVREAGGEIRSLHPLDLTEAGAIERVIAYAVETYGGLDVLYNNAAMFKRCTIGTVTREDWNFSVDNELTLFVMAAKAAVPVLAGRPGANIINVGSEGGMHGHGPGLLAHNTLKAAVIRFSELLAMECAQHGIRVNTLSPGPLRNPEFNDPKRDAYYAQSLLIGRMVDPMEVAQAALFLASDEASAITGTNLVVDGGATASGMRGAQEFAFGSAY